MKLIFPILYMLPAVFFFIGEAAGQEPAKKTRPPSFYTRLWTNCPFTIAPPKETKTDITPATAIDNWALSGFATLGGKKVVILMNKSNPTERLMVISGEKNEHNIELLEIDPGKSYNESRVKIKLGTLEGWVSYTPALLKLKEVPIQQPAKPTDQPQQGGHRRGN